MSVCFEPVFDIIIIPHLPDEKQKSARNVKNRAQNVGGKYIYFKEATLFQWQKYRVRFFG